MDYGTQKNAARTNAEQSETGGDLRVSFESHRIVADTGPIYQRMESLRKGIKMRRPFWPMGECVYFVGAGDGFVKIGYTTNLTSRAAATRCPVAQVRACVSN